MEKYGITEDEILQCLSEAICLYDKVIFNRPIDQEFLSLISGLGDRLYTCIQALRDEWGLDEERSK